MKTQFIIISLLLLGFTARAQQPYLSREAYRDKVEAYSQILKQQKLKTMASAEARKIAHTGFLPKIDVNADGTLNMSDLKAWNEPLGEYRNHTYQGVFVVSQPLYTDVYKRQDENRQSSLKKNLSRCKIYKFQKYLRGQDEERFPDVRSLIL